MLKRVAKSAVDLDAVVWVLDLMERAKGSGEGVDAVSVKFVGGEVVRFYGEDAAAWRRHVARLSSQV
jgi:hypothetical protein